jgi:hypothetical protein
MNLTAIDLANLERAAVQLEDEAESWEQGFAVWFNGEWRWNGEYPDQELRVMRLRNSARFMRDIRRKGLKSFPPDYQI